MAFNTIKLKKYLDIVVEYVANAAITPGMLIELMSSGKVRAHSGGGEAVAPKMFALEDELQGKSILDAYTSLDPVQVWVAVPGEVVYAILADGNDIDIGDHLESNGDGTLRKYIPGDSEATGHQASIVGVALEAVDTTGSPAATTSRIKVMVA
jgi:hypothetical protein